MISQVTIFCVDARWLGRESGPMFGARHGTQILPRGVWVVGFLVWKDGEVVELLAPPYIGTPEGRASYDACLKSAREVLADEWTGDEPYEGLVA